MCRIFFFFFLGGGGPKCTFEITRMISYPYIETDATFIQNWNLRALILNFIDENVQLKENICFSFKDFHEEN